MLIQLDLKSPISHQSSKTFYKKLVSIDRHTWAPGGCGGSVAESRRGQTNKGIHHAFVDPHEIDVSHHAPQGRLARGFNASMDREGPEKGLPRSPTKDSARSTSGLSLHFQYRTNSFHGVRYGNAHMNQNHRLSIMYRGSCGSTWGYRDTY